MSAINRRSFLAAAGAAAAPGGKIRIAFLGASHSHARDKIFLVRQSPSWDLAGIVEDDARVRAVSKSSARTAPPCCVPSNPPRCRSTWRSPPDRTRRVDRKSRCLSSNDMSATLKNSSGRPPSVSLEEDLLLEEVLLQASEMT